MADDSPPQDVRAAIEELATEHDTPRLDSIAAGRYTRRRMVAALGLLAILSAMTAVAVLTPTVQGSLILTVGVIAIYTALGTTVFVGGVLASVRCQSRKFEADIEAANPKLADAIDADAFYNHRDLYRRLREED